MVIFLSAETQAPAAGLWFQLQQELGPKLDTALSGKEYGDELVNIAIISVILPHELQQNGYKEKRLFKRKSRSADIWLWVDFNAFTRVHAPDCKEMYIRHILESIETLRHKVSRSYRFDELVADVQKALYDEP